MNSGMMLGAVFFIATVVAPALGQTIRPGKCPIVPSQAGFNVTKYLGFWYEIERFPFIFETDRCVRAEYQPRADGKVTVLNRDFDKAGKERIARGVAYAPDKNKPADLLVKFQYSPFEGQYHVVETDYTTYSLVTSCEPVVGRFAHVEFAWILSRKLQLAPKTVDRLAKVIGDCDFDMARFQMTDQSGCPKL